MKLVKYAAFILVPAFLVYTIGKVSPLLALFAAIIGFAALLFFLRADLCTAIGQYKFGKDHAEGFRWFERALLTGKMRPDSQLVYAYLLLRDGELEKAERLISKVTFLAKGKLKPNMVCGAKLNMALVKWKKGNLAEAIADMESLYHEDNYRSTVHYGTLGFFYILDGQYQKALEFNQEALEYNDTDKVIRDNLAQTHLVMGNLTTAKEQYEALLADNPTFVEPYFNYGLTLEKLGDFEGAIVYYKKALTYEEKYLSTVTRELIMRHLEGLEAKLESEKQ